MLSFPQLIACASLASFVVGEVVFVVRFVTRRRPVPFSR